jgi:hypothetical protein
MLTIVLLWILGLGIELMTLYLSYLSGFVPLLGALFFPPLAMIYWFVMAWVNTGTPLNLYAISCAAWIGLAVIYAWAQEDEAQPRLARSALQAEEGKTKKFSRDMDEIPNIFPKKRPARRPASLLLAE